MNVASLNEFGLHVYVNWADAALQNFQQLATAGKNM